MPAATPSTGADAPAAAFWAEYCLAAGLPAATPFQSWHFGDTPALAHELVELVLHGPKRATAGLVAWIERHPQDAAVADGYSVVTEHDGTPRAVVRTVWLDRRPLREVDAQFAWDEGEGDRTLADWMDGHRRYFSRVCPPLGIDFSDATEVQLERFELLYPFAAALDPVDCGPRIVPGYLPGAVGAVASLHAAFYAREHGFGVRFEARVAGDCAAFCARIDPARDGLWLLVDGGRILGSIAIDGSDGGAAHLRWVIVADALRGRGPPPRLPDDLRRARRGARAVRASRLPPRPRGRRRHLGPGRARAALRAGSMMTTGRQGVAAARCTRRARRPPAGRRR